MYAGIQFLAPILMPKGVPQIVAWPLLIWAPVIVLAFIVLFTFFRQTDRPTFSDRFNFQKMPAKILLITIGAFFVVQAGELLLSPTGAFFAKFSFFNLPPHLPDLFNPFFEIKNGLEKLFGVPLKGNWWFLLFWLGWLVVNIGGEELLWRGYALPMQEKYFGKYAWLVNGLCWNVLIHFFMRWNFVVLLPISLIIPFLVQRYKNTWIGVFIHGLGNLLVFVVLIPGILGK